MPEQTEHKPNDAVVLDMAEARATRLLGPPDPLVREARRTLRAHDDDRHDLLYLDNPNDPAVLNCVWCQS